MSKRQLSVVLDKRTRERLRAEARIRENSVSMLVRSLIVDGLNRLSQPDEVISRLVLEEMLITLFGLEALIANVFHQPKELLEANRETKNQLLGNWDSRARDKTRKLLNPENK